MALEPITETCEPRDDVLGGGLGDRHFAAQLDRVVAGDERYEFYTDPDTFFGLTHPTSGLKTLIRRVFGHLTGTDGDAILRSQTSFGGGKTHSLIALYHLARGHRPDDVDEFVDDPAILPDGPVRVAAVVGEALDPVSGATASGRTTYTLWGEIASQLGDDAWEAVADHDERRVAPGTERLSRMLDGDGPAVIVIDEIAHHLRVCARGDDDLRRQADQMSPFLKALTEVVAARDDVSVVITLATAADAYQDETEAVRRAIEAALKDTGSVSSRKGGDVRPADESEIANILRRRLFKSIDEDAAQAAANEFAEFYADISEDVDLPGESVSTMPERIAGSYPFHPALVEVLDQRVGTIPKFQRTRGALRLLSRVIAHYWDENVDAPPVLNIADLPLGADSVLTDLTDRIDRHQFREVIRADIVGESAHAAEVDAKRHQGRPVSRRAATTVLAHSLDQGSEIGATLPDITLGTLRPGDDPQLVHDALAHLHERAWHLAWDNVRWRFQTEPNEKRIVADEADRVLASKVADERHAILARMLRSTATIETHVHPDELDGAPDKPHLHLVVPHHDTVAVEGDPADVPTLIQEARAHHAGRPRKHRNGIAYLLPERDRVAEFDRAVRRQIAADTIVNDEARMATYNEQTQTKLRNLADKSLLDAHVDAGRTYKHLYYPSGDKRSGYLSHTELTPNVQGAIGDRPESSGRAWTEQVWEALVKVEKVRDSDKPLAPEWIRQKAWPDGADRIRTTDVHAVFWTDPAADLLTDTGPVIRGIQAGVLAGMWVVQDMRDATDGRGDVWSNRDGSTPRRVELDDDVWLVDYDTAVAEDLLATPTTVADVTRPVERAGDDGIGAVELRREIEQAKGGHEPTKQEVRDALAQAIRGKRATVYKDGEPVTAGDLTGDKVGFDDLLVKPYQPEGPEPVITRRKTVQGAAATAAEQLAAWASDQVAEGLTDGLIEFAITIEVDEDDATAASTLILLLGSVPDVAATFDADLTYGIDGTHGTVAVDIDGADRKQAQQKVKGLLADTRKHAAPPIHGTATLTFTFDEPHHHDSPAVTKVVEAVTTYFKGSVRLAGRVA